MPGVARIGRQAGAWKERQAPARVGNHNTLKAIARKAVGVKSLQFV